MSDFFHGWRRKMGCVLLIMAFVLTLGWIRSRVRFQGGQTMGDFFNGWRRKAGCVLLVMAAMLTVAWGWRGHVYFAVSFPFDGHKHQIRYLNGLVSWSSQSLGDSYGIEWNIERFQRTRHGKRRFDNAWEFPPWAPILSLTLFSAYLILWPAKRPAKRPQKSEAT